MVKVANNLQTQVPDQIMTWIGGSKSSLLGGFDNATGAVMDKTYGATQQAVNSGSQASQSFASGVDSGLGKAGSLTKNAIKKAIAPTAHTTGSGSDEKSNADAKATGGESKGKDIEKKKGYSDKKANDTFK